jgi:hypothetical protein
MWLFLCRKSRQHETLCWPLKSFSFLSSPLLPPQQCNIRTHTLIHKQKSNNFLCWSTHVSTTQLGWLDLICDRDVMGKSARAVVDRQKLIAAYSYDRTHNTLRPFQILLFLPPLPLFYLILRVSRWFSPFSGSWDAQRENFSLSFNLLSNSHWLFLLDFSSPQFTPPLVVLEFGDFWWYERKWATFEKLCKLHINLRFRFT